MGTAATAAVASLAQVVRREHHQALGVEVIVYTLDQFGGSHTLVNKTGTR